MERENVTRRSMLKKTAGAGILGVGAIGTASAAATRVELTNANEFNDDSVDYRLIWNQEGIKRTTDLESEDTITNANGQSRCDGVLRDSENKDAYILPGSARFVSGRLQRIQNDFDNSGTGVIRVSDEVTGGGDLRTLYINGAPYASIWIATPGFVELRSGNGGTGTTTCDGRTNETAAVSGNNSASFYFQGDVCSINYVFDSWTPLSETITFSFS